MLNVTSVQSTVILHVFFESSVYTGALVTTIVNSLSGSSASETSSAIENVLEALNQPFVLQNFATGLVFSGVSGVSTTGALDTS
jgi:shikimate kinase